MFYCNFIMRGAQRKEQRSSLEKENRKGKEILFK